MDFIFGYGSIINDDSRYGTLKMENDPLLSNKTYSRNEFSPYDGGNILGDESVLIAVSSLFAKRCWNFRCSTGFTALGLVLESHADEILSQDIEFGINDIHGVVFPITTPQQLRSFDLREVGYNRVCIPLKYVHVETEYGCDAARIRAKNLQSKIARYVENHRSKQENFDGISRMFSGADDDYGFQDLDDEINIPNPSDSVEIRIWVYVPDQTHTAFPNEDHPILQTYLDICIRGCLQWGGKDLAKKFLHTTYHWSECFLNDAPLSRRPWIYRKDYSLIDQCLSECAEIVKYSCRKHPEEYASLHQTAFKPGQWGLLPRNPKFTGREEYLRILHTKLTTYENVAGSMKQVNISTNSLQQPVSHFVINEVQIIGHGGVGKSQLTIEYAHRYLKNYYNFIAFIRAESFATISSDLRKLAFDLDIMNQSKKKVHQVNLDGTSPLKRNSSSFYDGIEQKDNDIPPMDELTLDDETISEEIRKRLSRCRFKWLLIFDNVDDPSVLSLCVPRGVEGIGCGHIIVTSRISHPDWSSRGTILNLHCFDEKESVMFLRSSLSDSIVPAGNTKEDKEIHDVLEKLAESLGYLPLALSTASVYMSRCDVDPREYLQRLESNTFSNIRPELSKSGTEVVNSQDALLNCFGLTLDRIETEHPSARSVLSCLGYLAPDISKEMVRYLLCCGHFNIIGPQELLFYELGSVPLEISPLPTSFLISIPNSIFCIQISHLIFSNIALFLCVIFAHKILPITFSFTIHDISLLSLGGLYGIILFISLFLFFLIHRSNISPFAKISFQISLTDAIANDQSLVETKPLKTKLNITIDDEIVRAETDQLWHSLRHFSLISLVRDNSYNNTTIDSYNRIGTIHRLQQSVLRARTRQSMNETLCLERSIWLLDTLWNFTPHDISTWKSSGDIIEHIQAVTRHITDFYSCTIKTNMNEKRIHSQYLLNLSKLLTNASQYTAIVLSKHDDSERLLHSSLNILSLIRDTLNSSSTSSSSSSSSSASASPTQMSSNEISQEIMLTQAHTLHMLGKVCRYNGKLVESEKFLKKSLELNKNLLSLGKKIMELSQIHRDEIRFILQNLSMIDYRRENHDCNFTEILQGLENSLLAKNSLSNNIKKDPTGEYLSIVQSRLGDTLHELGVLYLRTHHLQLSKSYLLSSLQIQSHSSLLLHIIDNSLLYMNKASSLYQLGVIHTIEQKYNLAHLFLDYSLKLMEEMNKNNESLDGQGTSTTTPTSTSPSTTTYPLGLSIMSKAAIFQQLGKIEYRKGYLLKAKEYMFLALNIYHHIYGDTAGSNYPTKSNINIACIHHQLGTIYNALHDYPSACEHLTKSLQIREIMLLEYKSGHILDYVISLQAIGRAEIENHGYDSALTYLLRAKQLIDEELRELHGITSRSSNTITDSSSISLMYRSVSSSTAFVGIDMMNVGGTSILLPDDEDVNEYSSNLSSSLNSYTNTTNGSTSTSTSYSLSSSYRDLLLRQLESCLYSLKKITKLQKDYLQFQEYAKELKLLKKRDMNLYQSHTIQSHNTHEQLLQSIHLPSNISLKFDLSHKEIVLEWDLFSLQLLGKLLIIRSNIRMFCLQNLKHLKQNSTPFILDRQQYETIRQALISLEDEINISEGGNTDVMEVIRGYVSGIKITLNTMVVCSSDSISSDEYPHLKQQFNTLLGYCDGIRSQLKQRGLILEDQK